MIQVTKEMVRVLLDEQCEGGCTNCLRGALSAVMDVVERDYLIEQRIPESTEGAAR